MGKFENTLKHMLWKPLKPMGKFENTLKHIIGKPLKPMGKFEKKFETDDLKTIETQGKFENILKHINLKPLKPMGKFEKFQTDNLNFFFLDTLEMQIFLWSSALKLAKKFNSTSFNLKQEVFIRKDEEKTRRGLVFIGKRTWHLFWSKMNCEG